MKGAVHGAATATANTPVKKAPARPRFCVHLKHARQVERHRKYKKGKACDRNGRLQLKPPTDGAAAGAQQLDGKAQRHKTQDGT
jgi:hypothetical protein